MFTAFPYGYSELNLIEGTYFPSEAKNINNYTYWYWFRALFQRATSTIDFKLPEAWTSEAKDFFYYSLFKYGYVAVFESNEFGISFNPCSLYGFDLYYQPTNCIIANPALKSASMDLKLHDEAELIRLTPDYLGVFDIIDYYATKLANMSTSIDMTVENSKLAYVLAGKTKSARETLKKIFDKISRGVTTIVFDSRVMSTKEDVEPFNFLTRDAKNSYVGTELLQDIQTVLNMFDREIGIPTIPYQKKERMVDFESKSALIDASSRLATWQTSLDESIAKVNAKFNLSISYETRIDMTQIDEENQKGDEEDE